VFVFVLRGAQAPLFHGVLPGAAVFEGAPFFRRAVRPRLFALAECDAEQDGLEAKKVRSSMRGSPELLTSDLG